MKLKHLWCIFTVFLVLSGCGNSKSENELTTEKQPIVENKPILESIPTSKVLENMKMEETFVLVFTQTTCTHCQTFKAMLQQYRPDQQLHVKEMILDQEADRNQALKDLEPVFPEFTGTPDLYYIEKGEIKSRFWNEYEEISEENFDEWIHKYLKSEETNK